MWGMVSASENNCKNGYWLVSVGISVRMERELPQIYNMLGALQEKAN
jgi:hypothetical protein